MQTNHFSIGIDISKLYLDVFSTSDNHYERFENNLEGINAIIEKYDCLRAENIICEPSGGYERLLMRIMQKIGARICLINARQIRDYARCKGILSKTDKIDAQLLADYGKVIKPKITISSGNETLRAHLSRRYQLKHMLTMEKQHLSRIEEEDIHANIEKHIEQIEIFIKVCDEDIKKLLCEDDTLSHKRDILLSVSGIGFVTAATLLSTRIMDKKFVILDKLLPPKEVKRRSRIQHIREMPDKAFLLYIKYLYIDIYSFPFKMPKNRHS